MEVEEATEPTNNESGASDNDSGSLLGDGQVAQGAQDQGQQEGTQAPEGDGDKFDFVLDRFRAEGKTETEAALEQAKGYNELRQKLGGFTGAPEEYSFELSDELAEKGVFIADDDPLMEQAKEMAKEMNMSQDGFQQMVNMYIESQLAEQKALENFRGEQMKELGSNAASRINGINQYINANFDDETAHAIRGMATTSTSIKAIEALIQRGRNAPVGEDEASVTPNVTQEEVEKMLFAKTESGQLRINVDPEFKKEYERKRDQLWGTHENRQIIG